MDSSSRQGLGSRLEILLPNKRLPQDELQYTTRDHGCDKIVW